jgi:hypothetical protein
MRHMALAAFAALLVAPAAYAQSSGPLAMVNVDEPAFCNANGLAPERHQPAGYAVPADKGGGTLEYVDKSRAECHQVVGKKPTGQYRRPTVCPLGSGRINTSEGWICRSQKPADS